jgi:hypothetical protein
MKIYISAILFLALTNFSIAEALRKVEIDLNNDKKIDRIESYKKNDLISVEISSDFSGHFDETIYYFKYTSPDKPIEISKKDTNGDGKIDRIVTSYKNPSLNILIYTTEVDSKFSGKFDKKWTSHVELDQKKTNAEGCEFSSLLEGLPIMKFADNVSKVRYKLDNGFYKTGWGYNIHQSCLDKWGAEKFPKLIQTGMKKGLLCLEKLAKENPNPKKPNGAYRNLKAFEYLLKATPITLICNEDKYNWEGTLGHASTSPNDKIEGSVIKHPFISLSPKTDTENKDDTIDGIIFHEQFHNIGLLHGKDMEYAYTCNSCCIQKEEDNKNACKLCAGSYLGSLDKQYLVDLTEYAKSSYRSFIAEQAILDYRQEFPNDRFSYFAYAYVSSGIFNPIGIELGKILKEKFPNRTPEEENFLKKSLEFNDYKEIIKSQRYSSFAAKAFYSANFENDKLKGIKVFEEGMDKIKELINLNSVTKSEDKKYIYENILKNIKSTLIDVFISKEPKDKEASILAYKILKDTKLLN